MKILHPYADFWEPLEEDPGLVLRPMFGGKAVYLDGRLMLYFTCSEEPWRGVLVCTDRERQPALQAEFVSLQPHPILPKWLYLPEADEAFERLVRRLVKAARARDPRLGVDPKPRKRKGRKTNASGRPRP